MNKKEYCPKCVKWHPVSDLKRGHCPVCYLNISNLENTQVENPKHYNYGNYEVIDVIEDWKLNFHLGNAVKYIARCEHEGDKITDLKKARFYIQREIERECKNEN